MPIVTVIIPTYNRADMLGDALDSLQRQSFGDWEAIVVDDGSTDAIADVMAHYARDTRIRYIYQQNKGLSGARNTGIRNAQGEYIALLDSDDVCLPNRLAQQLALFQQDAQVGLVAGGCIETDRHLKPIRQVENWHGTPTLVLQDFLYTAPFCPSAIMAKRDWFVQAGLFDESMKRAEDWDMWLRMVVRGCSCVWQREPACYYRLHGNNMMRDALLMRDGMLTMLDKLFAYPDLPIAITRQRDRAYANIYMNTAGRCFAAGDNDGGRAALGQALRLNPALVRGEPPQVLGSLASFSLMPMSGDSGAFMERVMSNLPDNAAPLHAWGKQRAQGLWHAVAAFEAAQRKERKPVIEHALQAIWRSPDWLRNRGLLAITGKAVLGRKRD